LLSRWTFQSGHWILIAAAAGAEAICFVTLSVLLVLIERPLEESKKIIGRVKAIERARRIRQTER